MITTPKPRLALLCCVLLASSLFLACGKSEEEILYEQRVFRNIHWGMSPQEVRERETARFELEATAKRDPREYYLQFTDVEYLGYACVLRYFFYNNECFEAAYYIDDVDMEEYEQIRSELVQLYGEPRRIYRSDERISDSWGGDIVVPYRYLHLVQDEGEVGIIVRFVFMPFAPL